MSGKSEQGNDLKMVSIEIEILLNVFRYFHVLQEQFELLMDDTKPDESSITSHERYLLLFFSFLLRNSIKRKNEYLMI